MQPDSKTIMKNLFSIARQKFARILFNAIKNMATEKKRRRKAPCPKVLPKSMESNCFGNKKNKINPGPAINIVINMDFTSK